MLLRTSRGLALLGRWRAGRVGGDGTESGVQIGPLRRCYADARHANSIVGVSVAHRMPYRSPNAPGQDVMWWACIQIRGPILTTAAPPLGQFLLQLPEVLAEPTSGAVHLDPAVDTVLHVDGGPGYRGTSCACSSSCMRYSWVLIQ